MNESTPSTIPKIPIMTHSTATELILQNTVLFRIKAMPAPAQTPRMKTPTLTSFAAKNPTMHPRITETARMTQPTQSLTLLLRISTQKRNITTPTVSKTPKIKSVGLTSFLPMVKLKSPTTMKAIAKIQLLASTNLQSALRSPTLHPFLLYTFTFGLQSSDLLSNSALGVSALLSQNISQVIPYFLSLHGVSVEYSITKCQLIFCC